MMSDSEYMKRDDQILALRLQNEEARNRMTKAARDKDRALAHAGPNGATADPDLDMEDEGGVEDGTETDVYGSKVIVIHPGSQNLRLGLGTDALPKTVPMVIARRAPQAESEENGGEPRPKRVKLDDGFTAPPETWFGEQVCCLLVLSRARTKTITVCERVQYYGGRLQDHTTK